MKMELITINYPPEIGGAAHLIAELAMSLHARGHEVSILTGYPTYNLKDVPREYQRGVRMYEARDGIGIHRIRVPSLPRTSKLARGLQHIMFGLWLAALALLTPRADVAIVFSPPLPLPWLICMVGKLRRMPVVVNIQDLFPREAVELGMLTNPLLIRMFEAMERSVHRMATAMIVHSPGNREHVINHGGNPERVQVVYNWVNTDHIRPGRRDNSFALEHGLGDRFVVSYAGTMGWAQDMGTIIDAAGRLRDQPKILFLLVGDGVEKEKAQARSTELALTNIIWLPMQPYAVYGDILAASDASLINLNPELHTPVVPSKLLSIMAAARPVVASLPVESDARAIIAEAGCGICVPAGDGDALASAIRQIAGNRGLASRMGLCGRAYVESRFDREVCAAQIASMLESITGGDACSTTWRLTRGRSF